MIYNEIGIEILMFASVFIKLAMK